MTEKLATDSLKELRDFAECFRRLQNAERRIRHLEKDNERLSSFLEETKKEQLDTLVKYSAAKDELLKRLRQIADLVD